MAKVITVQDCDELYAKSKSTQRLLSSMSLLSWL